MAGVTFLAFGNGSPDVFSTFAAMKTNSGSLAVGELIGAAGFITAVVAGSMALVRPFKVARKSFVRDVGFFIVAASFSMIFLADGSLHLWECAAMVAFYVFYVGFVVIWHWYLSQRSRRKLREGLARSHFHTPGPGEAEHEAYHDEDDDAVAAPSRAPSRTVSADDFANLEQGGSPFLRPMDVEADVDDETRDRYLAEISSNMRVSRPKRGERRSTVNPIRPSLVGALEFRAVLSSLQKSRSIQTIPINLRRYSDDPALTAAQQQDLPPSASNPETNHDEVDAHAAASKNSLRVNVEHDQGGPQRIRSVSVNDAAALQQNSSVLERLPPPEIDLLGATPPPENHGLKPPWHAKADRSGTRSSTSPASNLSVTSPANDFGYLSTSPLPMSPLQHPRSDDRLAPPDDGFQDLQNQSPRIAYPHESTSFLGDSSRVNSKPRVPKIQIPRSPGSLASRGSSPLSPFPNIQDDFGFPSSSRTPSLRLPPPSLGSESTFQQHYLQETEEKPMRWWPYMILPAPQVLISTLFPSLYSWKHKSIWEKMLGIVAAPSVFLLAITLPIVEADKEDDGPEYIDPDPGLLSPALPHSHSRSTTLAALPPDSPSIGPHEGDRLGPSIQSIENIRSAATCPPAIQISEPTNGSLVNDVPQRPKPPFPPTRKPSTPALDSSISAQRASSPKEWNRWLVATQIFTAPLFIVVLFWANTDDTFSARNLLIPCLYALITSLITFAILLLTTSPSHAPKRRYLLCFLGFIVSIAWISTIAGEVVGVLKAFGVILGISDAILGLTIFAVGNSLGDLVADITVARLGYPVMALSACFGGPMLNILLGIGVSGLYMTIQSGERRHEKHPGRPIKYKPYQIDVGETLLISGVTLLVTLLGLLVVVPLKGWWMDRKVGWGLVALWSASTVGNVAVEIWGRGIEAA